MATAQDVISRARQLINDVASNFVAGLRWSDMELLQWLTDGQREIVRLKPEAYTVTDIFVVEGELPRQRLSPTLAYRLIRVEANGAGPTGAVLIPPDIISISNSPVGGLDIAWSAAEFDGEPVGSYELYGIDSHTFNGSWSFGVGELVFADLPLVATLNGDTLVYRHSAAPSDQLYQSAYLVRAIAANSAAVSDSEIAYSQTPS